MVSAKFAHTIVGIDKGDNMILRIEIIGVKEIELSKEEFEEFCEDEKTFVQNEFANLELSEVNFEEYSYEIFE
jgi:hypothetical protein